MDDFYKNLTGKSPLIRITLVGEKSEEDDFDRDLAKRMKDTEFAKEYKKLELEELFFDIRRLGETVEDIFNSYIEKRNTLMDMIEKSEKLEKELKEDDDGI